jgi:uncharacterized phiE125 gp8 family phage protein
MAWKPDYCSSSEARDYLRITDAADTEADTEIALAITAASRAIDASTGRQFGSTTAEARVYTPFRSGAVTLISIDDVQTTTSLVVKTGEPGAYSTTIVAADYVLLPVNAADNGRPWTAIESSTFTAGERHSVEVTAIYGWTSVPTPIKLATLLQMSRFYKRRDAPFGVISSPDQASQVRLLAKLDPDVAAAIAPYRRYW